MGIYCSRCGKSVNTESYYRSFYNTKFCYDCFIAECSLLKKNCIHCGVVFDYDKNLDAIEFHRLETIYPSCKKCWELQN